MPSHHPHPPRRRPLRRQLQTSLRQARNLAVVGIGSDLRGDDCVGLLVLRELRAMLARPQRWSVATAGAARARNPTIRLFNGGTAPENFTGKITRFQPSHILLLDAADLGRKPGTVKLIASEAIGGLSFSTHVLPLSILAAYLKQSLPCCVMIIGIQPGNTAFGATPCRAIRQAARRLARTIMQAAPRPPPRNRP